MVSRNTEENQEKKRSHGSAGRPGGFFIRLFSPSRSCCCKGCTLKCCGKPCSSPCRGKTQERPDPLGNASKNCMD